MDDYAINTYKDVLSGSIKRFPKNFWFDGEEYNYEDSGIITRYLIEEILKWDEDMVKEKISCKVFYEHRLKGMLCVVYGDSVFKALENAYPGKYKEWELQCTPRNFWNIDSARDATIWLFREKLKYTDEQILSNISRRIFVENHLDTMMHVVFSNNATNAVKNAFPELF